MDFFIGPTFYLICSFSCPAFIQEPAYPCSNVLGSDVNKSYRSLFVGPLSAWHACAWSPYCFLLTAVGVHPCHPKVFLRAAATLFSSCAPLILQQDLIDAAALFRCGGGFFLAPFLFFLAGARPFFLFLLSRPRAAYISLTEPIVFFSAGGL